MDTEFSGPSKDGEPVEPAWARSGECARCGKCCASVVTALKYCPELDDYLLWLSYHVGVSVTHASDKGMVYVEFKNKCRLLRFRGGQAECANYHVDRPRICQDFPASPDSGIACRGFTFELASVEIASDPPPDVVVPDSDGADSPSRLKWDREGTCLRCGKCCHTISTTMAYTPEIRDYLDWLSLHQGVVVRRDRGTSVVWIEFKNKCRNLTFKRDRASCRIYDDRPKTCRAFPLDPMMGRNCAKYTFKFRNPA